MDYLQDQLLSTTTTPWFLVSAGRVEGYGAWEFARVGERVCLLCQCVSSNCAKRLKQISYYIEGLNYTKEQDRNVKGRRYI